MAFQALRLKATGHSQGLAYLTDIVAGGGITAIDEGEGILVNNTNPLQPIISTNLVAGANINITPALPPSTQLTISAILPAPSGVQSVVAGANVAVDNTDPLNPVVSAVYPVPDIPQYPAVSNLAGPTGSITLNGLGTSQLLTKAKLTYTWNVDRPALVQVFYNAQATMTTTGGHDLLSVSGTMELATAPAVIISTSQCPNYTYVRTQNEVVGFSGVLNFFIPILAGVPDTLDISINVQALLTNDDYTFVLGPVVSVLTPTQAQTPVPP